MRQGIVPFLALLSALTGCVAPPPRGPLVEYRPGQSPTTQPVKCPATYVLTPLDKPGAAPVAGHHVSKGERLGFRRAGDGSVAAVAPGYVVPLPEGAYAWEVMRGSVPPLRERVWNETRNSTAVVVAAAGVSTAFVGYYVLRVLSAMPQGR